MLVEEEDSEDVVVPPEVEVDFGVVPVVEEVMVVLLEADMVEDQVAMEEARVAMEAMEVDKVVDMEVDKVDMEHSHQLVVKEVMVNRLVVVMVVHRPEDMVGNKVAMGNSPKVVMEVPLKLQVVVMEIPKQLEETILKPRQVDMLVLASMVNLLMDNLLVLHMELDLMTAQVVMLLRLLMVPLAQLHQLIIHLVVDMAHQAMVLVVGVVDMEQVKVGVKAPVFTKSCKFTSL